MSAAQQTADPGDAASKPQKMVGESFVRFLAAPEEPPVNAERLRFADSIETPIPERGKKK